MANWCYNSIEVSGSGILAFRTWWDKWIVKGSSSVNHLKDLNVFTHEERNKYDSIELAGTDIIDSPAFDITNCYVNCESPWTPPNLLLERLARVFRVDIRNEYEESMMGFAGVFKVLDGVSSDDCLPYLEFLMKYDYEEQVVSEMEAVYDGGNDPDADLSAFSDHFGEDKFNDLVETFNNKQQADITA